MISEGSHLRNDILPRREGKVDSMADNVPGATLNIIGEWATWHQFLAT